MSSLLQQPHFWGPCSTVTCPLGLLRVQHAAATASRVGVVQFMLLPKEDELEDDGHDD